MFTLIMWVAGCSFDGCPVSTYEVQYFAEESTCIESRDVWRKISKRHEGHCLEGKIASWEELIADL